MKIRANNLISLLILMVLAVFGTGCGGGGGGGGSAAPEELVKGEFLAKIISPVEAEVDINRGDSVNFLAFHTLQEDCEYEWNFGDGRTSIEKEPGVVSYSRTGDYTVTLSVSHDGKTLRDTRTVHVLEPEQLNASIVSPVGAVTIFSGGNIQFIGNATGGGTQKTYAWNFGNGQTSSLKEPGFITYNAAGEYDVTLTVTDNLSANDTATVHVSVSDVPVNTVPVASIITPSDGITTITEGDSITFMGSVTSGEPEYIYNWDFDGVTGDRTELNGGTVTFDNAGTYTITFTVTDSNDDTTSDTKSIVVNPRSTASGEWAFVSAGETHTLAIKKNGSLWAFGNGANGKLGTNKTATEYTPVLVDNGPWLMVTAGGNHSFGIKADQTLWAWGKGAGLGLETDSDVLVPTQVGTEAGWQAIAAGFDFTLAIKGGALYATGANEYGQLGLGDTTARNTFVQVGVDNDWAHISCGYQHAAALKGVDSHDLYVWGINLNYQLGLDDRTTRTSPVLVGTSKWNQVSCGYLHTLAIRSDAELHAAGYNGSGACGNGSMGTLRTFTRVGSLTWAIVYTGPYSRHSLGIPTNDLLSIYATGENASGQLGTGDLYDDISFTRMSGVDDILSASGGWDRTVVVKENGTMWATGDNFDGHCGLGSEVLNSRVFVEIE